MTPIKQGTASKLGLGKPHDQPTWEVTVAPIVPPNLIVDFVRQMGGAHNQAIADINRIIYKVATGVRRSRPER